MRTRLAVLAVVCCALTACQSAGSPPTDRPSAPTTSAGSPFTARPESIPGLPARDENVRASCASRTFCELISTTGLSWTWRGTAWVGPVRFAVKPDVPTDGRVSCAGPTFCMASLGDQTFTYDGRTWTRTPAGSWAGGVGELACAGPQLCFAGPTPPSSTGLNQWTRARWSAMPVETLDGLPTALSCARDGDTCAAAGRSLYVHVRGVWLAPYRPSEPALDVSCSAATFCLAADNDSYATFDGSAWGDHPVPAGITLRAVSCAGPTFCIGLDRTSVAIWNGMTWTVGGDIADAAALPVEVAGVATLSCPQAGWCMAATSGATFVYSA